MLISFLSKIGEGKAALKDFCIASGYEYDENLVDDILLKEQELQEQLNIESKNPLHFPKMRIVIFKLMVAWFAASMLYFGIVFGRIPGGVLFNNFILGALSTIFGPVMCLLMRSRFPYRRPLLATLYLITGMSVLTMAFTTQYKDSMLCVICGCLSYGIMAGAFGYGM